MRQLQFVGVSDDGAQLLFRDPASRDQFQVPLDDRLRAASRNDRSRLGQIELELSSTLRPREIQARIRAGETPEAVAAAADAPLQRVMRFAYPVLQEREQVTVEARRTRIRRSDSARRLGDQVEDRLIKQGIDPDTATWDAFRREDGTWWVTLRWQVGEKQVTAQWSFDLPGRTLTPADDVAAELQAEQPRRRRIAAVPFVPDEDPDEVDDDEGGDYREPESRPAESYRTGQPSSAHPARREPTRPSGREPLRRPIRVARAQEPPAERYPVADPEDAPPGPVSVVSAPQRRTEPSLPREHGRVREQRPDREPEQPENPVRPKPPAQREAAVRTEIPEAPEAPPDATEPAQSAAAEPAQAAAQSAAQATEEPDAEDAKAKAGRGRKPKVPSWDDIVFGTRGRQ